MKKVKGRKPIAKKVPSTKGLLKTDKSKSKSKLKSQTKTLRSSKKNLSPLRSIKKPSKGGTKSEALPEQLKSAALRILDARKAEDIVTINLKEKSAVADYLIIASGQAARQVAALAHYLEEAFLKLGVRPVKLEGLPQANWVIVDAGDVIVHLFRPEVRQYYNLEQIWRNGKIDSRRGRT